MLLFQATLKTLQCILHPAMNSKDPITQLLAMVKTIVTNIALLMNHKANKLGFRQRELVCGAWRTSQGTGRWDSWSRFDVCFESFRSALSQSHRWTFDTQVTKDRILLLDSFTNIVAWYLNRIGYSIPMFTGFVIMFLSTLSKYSDEKFFNNLIKILFSSICFRSNLSRSFHRSSTSRHWLFVFFGVWNGNVSWSLYRW